MSRVGSQFARYASFTVDTLFRGKWKVEILYALCSGPLRLGQIARMIPRASKKVLTQNLRDLEAAGIVVRQDFSDRVLHVEYDLNKNLREDITALVGHLSQWGETYLRDGFDKNRKEAGGSPGGGT